MHETSQSVLIEDGCVRFTWQLDGNEAWIRLLETFIEAYKQLLQPQLIYRVYPFFSARYLSQYYVRVSACATPLDDPPESVD